MKFETSCCNLKIRSLRKKSTWGFCLFIFCFRNLSFCNELYLLLSCEKKLLNIANVRKGIPNFPGTILQSFMITTRVRLSLVRKKDWLRNLGLAAVQTCQIFDRFFRRDTLTSKYSKANFDYGLLTKLMFQFHFYDYDFLKIQMLSISGSYLVILSYSLCLKFLLNIPYFHLTAIVLHLRISFIGSFINTLCEL